MLITALAIATVLFAAVLCVTVRLWPVKSDRQAVIAWALAMVFGIFEFAGENYWFDVSQTALRNIAGLQKEFQQLQRSSSEQERCSSTSGLTEILPILSAEVPQLDPYAAPPCSVRHNPDADDFGIADRAFVAGRRATWDEPCPVQFPSLAAGVFGDRTAFGQPIAGDLKYHAQSEATPNDTMATYSARRR